MKISQVSSGNIGIRTAVTSWVGDAKYPIGSGKKFYYSGKMSKLYPGGVWPGASLVVSSHSQLFSGARDVALRLYLDEIEVENITSDQVFFSLSVKVRVYTSDGFKDAYSETQGGSKIVFADERKTYHGMMGAGDFGSSISGFLIGLPAADIGAGLNSIEVSISTGSSDVVLHDALFSVETYEM